MAIVVMVLVAEGNKQLALGADDDFTVDEAETESDEWSAKARN